MAVNPSFEEDHLEDDDVLEDLSLQSPFATEEVVTSGPDGPTSTQHSIYYLDYKSPEPVSFKMFYDFLFYRMRQAFDRIIHTTVRIIQNIHQQ